MKLYLRFLKSVAIFYNGRRVVQSSNVRYMRPRNILNSVKRKIWPQFLGTEGKGVAELKGGACDSCGEEGRRGLQNGRRL